MKQDHQSNLETHNNLSHDKSQAVFNKDLLIGRSYCFYSASGSSILSLTNSKIRSEVCIGEDRIYISTIPKKFNKVPEILLQDILGGCYSDNRIFLSAVFCLPCIDFIIFKT